MLSAKDPVPVELRSNVVYKFTCANCNSCYFISKGDHKLIYIFSIFFFFFFGGGGGVVLHCTALH